MDGQDYGFDIQEEEIDLLADAYNETAKPVSTYTPEDKTKTEEESPEKPEDIKPEDVDLLENEAEKPESEEGDETETEEIPESVDTFQKLSEDLVDLNIFSLDEGEEKVVVKSPEEFAERFQKEYQKGAISHIQNTVGQYGPEYAEAWEIIFEKGLNPYDYFTSRQQIDNYESLILDENEEAQKKVYRDYMSKQGFQPDKIEARLQKLIDYGDLEDEAKQYHEILVNTEKQSLQAKAQAAAQAREFEEQARYEYGKSVQTILNEKVKEKDFDGIPVTPKVAEKTFDFLYTPKWQLPDGRIITDSERWLLDLKDPKNHALAVKWALMAQDGFDTSKIQKKGVSKNKEAIFNNLTQQNKVTQRQAPTRQQNGSSFFD